MTFEAEQLVGTLLTLITRVTASSSQPLGVAPIESTGLVAEAERERTMRYTVQAATAADVAHIANRMSETGGASSSVAVNHLLRSCAFSRQLWAARDLAGTPAALWGVVPAPDHPGTGRLWMMLVESDEQDRHDLADSSRLVVDEMLTEFGELENIVSADSSDAIEVLSRMGFHLGPPLPAQMDAPLQRRAWLEAGEGTFADLPRVLN